jgi:RNA polymerase sigma factor (sigma-70 family)
VSTQTTAVAVGPAPPPRARGTCRSTSRIPRVTDDLPTLVAAAARSDQVAWNTLVDRFSGLVWHVVRGFRLPDAVAEDAYQTTWLRLTEHLDRIRQPESLAGWLARTARNECLRTIRLSQREHLTDDTDDTDDGSPGLDARQLTSERDAVLWAAFGTLGDRCQELLRLLLADPPIPYETISEMLDMPIGSIGPTRARCLQKLRAADGVADLREDR